MKTVGRATALPDRGPRPPVPRAPKPYPTRRGPRRVRQGTPGSPGPPAWQVGDRWTYRVRILEEGPGQRVVRVAAREPFPADGTEAWRLDVSSPDSDPLQQWYRVGDLAELGMRAMPGAAGRRGIAVPPDAWRVEDPPCPWLPFPLAQGAELEDTFLDAEGERRGRWMRVGGSEEVRVPAGTFACIRVDTEIETPDGPLVLADWYAPAVGNVALAHARKGRFQKLEELVRFDRGT